MSRRVKRSVPLLAVIAAALCFAAVVPVAAQGGAAAAGRLAGTSRIETAVAISQHVFPDGAATVYLARADEVVDAVAGGSLTDGPILLVPSCGEVPAVVLDEIARLAPLEVIALGGTAAVCDDVLEAAAAAASGGQPEPPDQAAVVVDADVELVEATATPPFAVDATDPGLVTEGSTVTHQVRFTGTAGTVVLADPRFSDVVPNAEGEGQLVAAGRGCGPMLSDEEPGVVIVCQDDFAIVEVVEGQTTPQDVRLHTDDAEVGPTPLLPRTYVLDQVVAWDDDTANPTFDAGEVIVRVTYTVSPNSEHSRVAVVDWNTPDGTFSTNGHSPADLAVIAAAIENGASAGIPNGVARWGDGGVNLGHVWHLEHVALADLTIEVCDGTAQMVDDDPDYWIETVRQYCPWSALPTAIHEVGA